MSSCWFRVVKVALVICSVVFQSSTDVVAQKKTGAARFAVDLVTLDSGKRLRGAFLGVDADGIVSMVVQRAWLKKTHPKMYAEVMQDERNESELAANELRDRIQQWLDGKSESRALVAFLKVERERVQKQPAKPDDARGVDNGSQFVLVKFHRREADYSFAQSPENRRIATLSWRERLTDVETREASDLEEQLRRLKIDPVAERPNLADRLPPVRQDEAEWVARRAVVEYSLAGGLDFQGIGNTLIRTDGGAKKMGLEQLLPELLPQLLQDQLGGQLADLLQEPGLNRRQNPAKPTQDFTNATREAEKAGFGGVRVTTLDLNLQRKQAVVETRFLAKLPDGKWQTIWSHRVSEDTSKPRPDLQQQIENDPQVAEALKLAKSVGLGAGGQLDVAMNFGAATMEAQQAADREFFHFVDQYVQRLDRPRLEWDTSK